MKHLQISSKKTSTQFLYLMMFALATWLYATTAHAAPLFEEPVNYEVGAVDENGEGDGSGDGGGNVTSDVVADFNGDGFLDIAGTIPVRIWDETGTIPIAGDDGLVILINDGDGTFTVTDYISHTYAESPTDIVSEDFDGDGDADLAVVYTSTDRVTIFLNDSAGVFTVSSQIETGFVPEELDLADFDGDSDIDLVLTTYDGTQSGSSQGDAGVQIFSNDGNGEFMLGAFVPTDTPEFTAVADFTVADFDGDSDMDIMAGSGNGDTIYSVMMNDGNGDFQATEFSILSADPENSPAFDRITSGDIDNDGDVDVVATIDGTQEISLLTLVNDGTGLFTLGQTFYSEYPGPVVASDFDDDGDIDIITSSVNPYGINLFKNDGSGFFAIDTNESMVMTYLETPTSLNAADLNNDGKNDLIVSSGGQSGIWVILQAGTENPTPTEQAVALVNNVINLDLPNNLENSYLANLFKVEGFIESGQATAAINQLNAFINKVNQDYNQGKITQQMRDDFVAAAQQLIEDLTS